MKTNIGLVEYCKAQLGRPYWYGTFGHKASESLLRRMSISFPQYYKGTDFAEQYGLKVHDCSGLIKGYFFCETPDAFYSKYDPSIDCGIKYENCKEKGDIKTIPELSGVLVFMPGHVGVYIGNGEVIEARGHAYGVVKTKLKERPWKTWGKLPQLTYKESGELFEEGEELEALEYLVSQGRITNKELALKKLDVVKDEKWIFIKWANDVKKLNS